MNITITPAGEFYMFVGIAVQVWRGTTDDGAAVTALVAAVSDSTDPPGGVIGLHPLPPPVTEWSQRQRYLMQRVWQLGDRLTEAEAEIVATQVEAWVAVREGRKR